LFKKFYLIKVINRIILIRRMRVLGCARRLSLSAYRPSFSSIQDIPEVQEQYFHFLKDLEKYAQLRRKCPTIYHGEELKNQLHANPYNTYVNNHRIVGTVTDKLYESGSPVNLLEIITDTVEADQSVYEKKERIYDNGKWSPDAKAVKYNKFKERHMPIKGLHESLYVFVPSYCHPFEGNIGDRIQVDGPMIEPHVQEQDRTRPKSVSTALTIAENIIHDVQIPFDINHFLYIGKMSCTYRNPHTLQGSCMYKFNLDSFFSDVCEINIIQRTDMYKKKNLALVAQSDNLFERQLDQCELPRGFWRGNQYGMFQFQLDRFDTSTIKPLTFTGIFTGSLGAFVTSTGTPPLYDGLHQSRIHGLSFSPMDSFLDLGIDLKLTLDLLKNHNFTFKTKQGKLDALRVLVEANSILPDTFEHKYLLEGRKYDEPRNKAAVNESIVLEYHSPDRIEYEKETIPHMQSISRVKQRMTSDLKLGLNKNAKKDRYRNVDLIKAQKLKQEIDQNNKEIEMELQAAGYEGLKALYDQDLL